AHPEGAVVLVSHGDVIRAGLAFALGMPIEYLTRIEIATGALSTVRIDDSGIRVINLNDRKAERPQGVAAAAPATYLAGDACAVYRPSLYRRHLYRRQPADRRRKDGGSGLRRVVRRKRGHRRVLLRQARGRAGFARLGGRRLARAHVSRYGGALPHPGASPQGRRLLAVVCD